MFFLVLRWLIWLTGNIEIIHKIRQQNNKYRKDNNTDFIFDLLLLWVLTWSSIRANNFILQQGVKYVNKCFGFKAVIKHWSDIYQSGLFTQFQLMTAHATSNDPKGHNGETETYHHFILHISKKPSCSLWSMELLWQLSCPSVQSRIQCFLRKWVCLDFLHKGNGEFNLNLHFVLKIYLFSLKWNFITHTH